MNDASHFVEIQGTAEGHAFRREEMDIMLDLAGSGIAQLFELQEAARASRAVTVADARPLSYGNRARQRQSRKTH